MTYTGVIILGIACILAAACLAVFIIYRLGFAGSVFDYCFTRGQDKLGRNKWGRACSDPTNRTLYAMWEAEEAWADKYRAFRTEEAIVSGGVKLHAQYFNFDSKSAVIIIPGMHETSIYACYYADIFRKSGFNCLLVDPRSTGLSEGTYNTAGKEEQLDTLEWGRHLRENLGIENIVVLGIAGGAAAASLALSGLELSSQQTGFSSVFKGLILDSCYADFKTFFRNYMIACGYKLHAYKRVLNKLASRAGVAFEDINPIDAAPSVKIPLLFLHGNSDNIVSDTEAQTLFNSFGSKNKKFVSSKNAGHALLRFSNPDEYDMAITEFLKENNICGTSTPSEKETTSKGHTFANKKIRRLPKTVKNITT